MPFAFLMADAEEIAWVNVCVRSLAGHRVAELSLPETATVVAIKRHIHETTRAFPRFQQQVVHGLTTLNEGTSLAEISQRPVELTVLLLPYMADMGETLLRSASDGDVAAVRQALNSPTDPNYVDADGWTPLFIASENGHLEVVRLLRDAGTDMDEACEDGGATPLHIASQNGHLEVVRLLCDAGADKDKACEDGSTPLYIASQNGHLEVVRLLCEAPARRRVRRRMD